MLPQTQTILFNSKSTTGADAVPTKCLNCRKMCLPRSASVVRACVQPCRRVIASASVMAEIHRCDIVLRRKPAGEGDRVHKHAQQSKKRIAERAHRTIIKIHIIYMSCLLPPL